MIFCGCSPKRADVEGSLVLPFFRLVYCKIAYYCGGLLFQAGEQKTAGADRFERNMV